MTRRGEEAACIDRGSGLGKALLNSVENQPESEKLKRSCNCTSSCVCSGWDSAALLTASASGKSSHLERTT